MPQPRRLVATSITAAGVLALALGTGPAASAATAGSAGENPNASVTVASDQPTYTAATPTGAVADGSRVSFSVDLASDRAGLAAFGRAVSTPGNALYHHYLTNTQIRDRYGATPGAVASVTRYLTGKGLAVTAVSPTRMSLSVSGTAAQVRSAFATSLKLFRSGQRTLRAPAGALHVPAGVASGISGVRGLAQLPRFNTPQSVSSATAAPAASSAGSPDAPPGPGFINNTPCSTYFGQQLATTYPQLDGKTVSYVPCGYTPAQLRSAYGVASLVGGKAPIDGRGTRVAITDAYASPTIASDAAQYSANRGEPGFAANQFVQLAPQTPYEYGYDDTTNGDLCGEQGWYGEETLDVEAIHGMAPGAQVIYAPSGSCVDSDFQADLANLVENQLADEISNSWGDAGEIGQFDQASLAEYQTIFSEASAEGIGIYFSSGDSGDETHDGNVDPSAVGERQADFPASDPLVTAVGGTSLGVGAQGQYLFERAWNVTSSTATTSAYTPAPPNGSYSAGGGGGASRIFAQPYYQQGVVPDSQSESNGSSRPMRTVPDVAMDADAQTGMLIGETQTFLDGDRYGEYRIGGTSLAAPLMAAVMAIADQAGGYHHGFINPALYQLNGSSYLHDVTGTYPITDSVPGVPDSVSTDAVIRHNYGTTNGISDPSKDGGYFLRTFAAPSTIPAVAGYDQVTGVGTPAPGFVTHIGMAPAGAPYPTGGGTTPPPALDEAPLAAGLPVVALLGGGLLVGLRRRRRATA